MIAEVNGVPVGTFNEFREFLGIPEGAGSPPLVTTFYGAYLGVAREQLADGAEAVEGLHDGPNVPLSEVPIYAGTIALLNMAQQQAA